MKIAVVDVHSLVHNWWVVLVRGIAAILFGIGTLLIPGVSIAVLVLVFAGYALVTGALTIVSAIRGRSTDEPRWALAMEGILGLAAGAFTLSRPGITALALVLCIGAWAFVTGILEIMTAVRLRKVIEGEWLLVLSGVASIVLGLALLLFPAAGAVAVVLWIGAYALFFGVLLVALGLRLRSFKQGPPEIGTRPDIEGTPQHG